jgi:hypothetical protein
METVTQDMYNPHVLVTLKKLINTESGDVQFELYKATELEELLFANPTITALEGMPDGTHKEHTLTRADISEMFRKAQYREEWLTRAQGTISKIIDNLTVEGWYNPNTDKEEVLRDLCEILDHTPQQEMSWSATLTVSGTTLVNLDEVEDFDIRYHIGDNLSVDSNDFDTKVDSWDVDYIDSQEWN